MIAVIGSVVAGAGAIGWASGAIQAPATTSAAALVPTVTGDPRVDTLLARMSLADKLRLLTWAGGQSQTAVLPGLRRFGIPALHLAEGPLGTPAHPAPAMTSPLAVAATFSQADANATGMTIGRDARALGQQAVARPFAALGWGQASATGASFGEDPLLAGQIAAGEIAGIQTQGTMAVLRGYLAGNAGASLLADAQALHQIYLQPVEAAVRAGAAGVLCPPGTAGIVSASRAGPHPPTQPTCGDAGLLTQVLRRELGFGGFAVADQGASPGMVSLDSGLDGQILQASRPQSFTPAAVRAALASGTIGVATINQAAGAVLAEMDRFGLLGRPTSRSALHEPAAADQRAVAQTAEDAATLLKNTGRALPLAARQLGSLALIGPGAAQVIGAGPEGGNGYGAGPRPGTLQVLRRDLAGNPAAHVSYAAGDDMTGTPVPAAVLSHDGQPGLVRATASARAGGGTTRIVSTLDSTPGHDGALPAGSAHTWTGELTVPATGSYWINLAIAGARATLTVDGSPVAQSQPGDVAGGALLPTTDGLDNLRASLPLSAGTHTLGVSQTPDGSGRPVQVRLDWVTPAQQQAGLTAAVAAARGAKAAVVFAWSGPPGTAGPAGVLPDGQDQLISDVAAVNPDTIVVLNTPGPVALPWLHQVRAVLEMWYPGDGGGSATADVLLGRADPAGRLPVTWPATAGRAVTPGQAAPAHPQGLLAGYRWYDKQRVAPLFGFGYGLSYTHFRYSGLTWRAAPGGGLTVRFHVANTGTVAGQEVPQVYLGAPATRPPGAAFAVKALAAFTRISLRPGQARAVTLRVPRQQLQYWDDARGWVTVPGRRQIDVGPGERSTALSATATIPG